MPEMIPVEPVARELGVSTAVVLQVADDVIDRLIRTGGLEAARGYSTGTRRQSAMITPQLAEAVRRELDPSRTSG